MFKFIGLGSITGASKDFEAPIAPIAPLRRANVRLFTTVTNDGELELPIETRTPSIANVHNVGGKIPRGVARRSLFFTRHQ